MGILPGHSSLSYWLFLMLMEEINEPPAQHNPHLSPLLSHSCQTECVVWHSYTSQTPLLLALWWTRRLPSGHLVSPKQTTVNHCDSFNYITEQAVISFGVIRQACQMKSRFSQLISIDVWANTQHMRILEHTAVKITHRTGVDC